MMSIRIPEFMSSNEAIEFGKLANKKAICFLNDRRQNYLDSISVMREIDGEEVDFNTLIVLACKVQFCSEAIATIRGEPVYAKL